MEANFSGWVRTLEPLRKKFLVAYTHALEHLSGVLEKRKTRTLSGGNSVRQILGSLPTERFHRVKTNIQTAGPEVFPISPKSSPVVLQLVLVSAES